MTFTRYQSMHPLAQLQSDINRLFTRQDTESSGATADWMPAVDIYEYDDRFVLFADVPGVAAEDVEVTLNDDVLTLSGERAPITGSAGAEEVKQRRVERGQGRFYRRFILPDTVDAEKVEAKSRNGVLEISIQKQAKAQPRRIKVAA